MNTCPCGAATLGHRLRCEDCRAANRRAYQKLRAIAKLDRGECVLCPLPSDGGTLCPTHRAESRARYTRKGLPVGRRPDPRCDGYVEQFRAGLSIAAIAVAVHRSRSAVASVLRHRGALPPVPSEQRLTERRAA